MFFHYFAHSRNITTATNFPLPQSHNSSGLPPKHSSTPLVGRPTSRGSAAAAALGSLGQDFMHTPIAEGKTTTNDVQHKENLSPRSENKDSFGLDPKYRKCKNDQLNSRLLK